MKELEKEFAAFVRRVNSSIGLDNLTSEIIAVLYLEPGEISMEEIAERTGYSLASVCLKLKQLQNFQIVSRGRKPGSKKVYFYMDKDVLRMVHDRLMMLYEYKIKPAREFVPKLVEKYKGKKLDEQGKKKLEILHDYIRQVDRVDKVMRNALAELNRER